MYLYLSFLFLFLYTISYSRLVSHDKTLEIDHLKRPPDQYMEIRQYTAMDKTLWTTPDVCAWYNSGAGPEIKYNLAPSQTGYTIRTDDS